MHLEERVFKSFHFITVQGMEKTSWLEPLGPTQFPALPSQVGLTYTQPCYCCFQSAYNSADACLGKAGTAALSLGGLPALSGCLATKVHREQMGRRPLCAPYPLTCTAPWELWKCCNGRTGEALWKQRGQPRCSDISKNKIHIRTACLNYSLAPQTPWPHWGNLAFVD